MAEILHQLIGSLSHYLQGFIHHRWCRISSINSMTGRLRVLKLTEMQWILLGTWPFTASPRGGRVLKRESERSEFSSQCAFPTKTLRNHEPIIHKEIN